MNKRPRARALKSKGTAGKKVRLRYRIWDDGERTRERIRVFNGGRRIAQVRSRLGTSRPGQTYYLSWKAPKSLSGFYRFCVVAWDSQRRQSKPSCGRLDIKQPVAQGGTTKPPGTGGAGTGTSPPVSGGVGMKLPPWVDRERTFSSRGFDGEVITLFDQLFHESRWRVDNLDRHKTIGWRFMDDILIVDNRSQPPFKYDLIHVNTGVVVTASFLGSP